MKRIYIYILLAMASIINAYGQTTSQNHVLTRTMSTAEGTTYTDRIEYADGLGRTIQEVQKSVSPTVTERLVTLQRYDDSGRKKDSWLPIPSNNDYLDSNTFRSQAPGNYGNDSHPYSQVLYDNSPLNRTRKEFGPGSAWISKPVSKDYLLNTNTGTLSCIRYYINASNQLTNDSNNRSYPENTLFVNKLTDEDDNVGYEFLDKQGRTILTKQMNGGTSYDTYYVYDDAGNLRYVLPPLIEADISAPNLHKYAYSYQYDNFNRCIEKKLPGCQPIRYAYDTNDRMIFSQDGEQATRSEWTYYLYDNLSRIVEQGLCTNQSLNSKVMLRLNYYDNYNFRTLTGFNNDNFPAPTVNATGMPTGSVTSILGDSSRKLYAAIYYDHKGNPLKVVSGNHLGGYDVTTNTYTFTNQPENTELKHTAVGKSTQTQLYTYTYDQANRLTKVTHKLNSNGVVTLAAYTYDELGRLRTKKPHGGTINPITYTYNIRNWTTSITSNRFTQNLYYNTGYGAPQFGGNISSMTWKAGAETTLRGYKFVYDKLDRLKEATYGEGANVAGTNKFGETPTYDKHGNITQFVRMNNGTPTTLSMQYTGNQLSQKGTSTYAYDANGNMTVDNSKNISNIQYNNLNLPKRVALSDSRSATYLYDATGVKLQVVHQGAGINRTTDYCGSVIYESTIVGGQNVVLSKILTEEGYITLSDETPTYHYYLKDHLGNNRVVMNSGGTVEQVNHYYPFGGLFDQTAENLQNYKYNGKELDRTYGIDLYDYSARFMEPALGRFTTMDPMAEKYYSISPYTYCLNNPIILIDHNGKWPSLKTIKQKINIGIENTLSFVNGASRAFADNLLGGSTDLRETGDYYNQDAYNAGQNVGDVLSVLGGTFEVVDGSSKIVGGVLAAPETGGASLPVVGLGTAEVAHGGVQIVSGIKNLSQRNGRVSEARSSGRGGKGERNRTAKPEGTDNPFKKMKPDPKNSDNIIYKDADGKDKSKPKPKGFDEYWNKKHPSNNKTNK